MIFWWQCKYEWHYHQVFIMENRHQHLLGCRGLNFCGRDESVGLGAGCSKLNFSQLKDTLQVYTQVCANLNYYCMEPTPRSELNVKSPLWVSSLRDSHYNILFSNMTYFQIIIHIRTVLIMPRMFSICDFDISGFIELNPGLQ